MCVCVCSTFCLILVIGLEDFDAWKLCYVLCAFSVELPSTSEGASHVQHGRYGRHNADHRQILHVGEDTTASTLTCTMYYVCKTSVLPFVR